MSSYGGSWVFEVGMYDGISSVIYIYIHALWAFPKSEGNCPQKKCCELMIGWMILGATIGGNRHMDHPPFGV